MVIKQYNGNVIIWACSSHNDTGTQIEETLNRIVYCNILQSRMILKGKMSMRWLFQNDNDSEHSSKLGKLLVTNSIIRVSSQIKRN